MALSEHGVLIPLVNHDVISISSWHLIVSKNVVSMKLIAGW